MNRTPSAPAPARDYRIRLYLDAVHGPVWLELLCAFGWGLGVVTEGAYQVDTERSQSRGEPLPAS